MLKNTVRKIRESLKKYRKVVIAILAIYAFWFFGLGILGGWLLSKGTLASLPDLSNEDRILILAPHIDDEVLGAGGLIQEAIKVGAKIKIVYVTNGDNSTSAVITENKTINPDPNEFISLGENRMREGESAAATLGLQKTDIVFLGYPDQGLEPMLNTYYNTPYTSKGTKFNYNPYHGTMKEKQSYTGQNLASDLQKIYTDFKPTIIISSHPRDKHPDHRAVYKFIEKVQSENRLDTKMYTYLVHYTLYPPQKKLQEYTFLYPPKNLFTKEGWYSYDLSIDQENLKLSAIEKNVSQMQTMSGFLKSFIRRNEIFELMN